MAKKKAPQKPQDTFPKVIETFRHIGLWELSGMDQKEPSCFNGEVRVERYRVTVEKIEEPLEVIHERLKKLWREADNSHHFAPIHAAATRYGLELDDEELGKDRPKR